MIDISNLSYDALNDLPVGVFWFDKNANILGVNKMVKKYWGYSEKEFLKLTIFDVNPEMSPETWAAHWKAKQKDPSTFEGIHKRKNGTLFPVTITDNFVKYEGEVYCCAIITDVTDQKEADRQSRLAGFTVQKTSDAIFWLSPEGAIKHTNEAAISRYGYTKEELLKMNIRDISKDTDKAQFQEIWKTLEEHKKLEFVGSHYNKEGKEIPSEISANFLSFESVDYGSVIIRDITERKQKQAALRGALVEIRELQAKIKAENNYLQEEIKIQNNFDEIVSTSKKFQKVLKQIEQVADTDSTVLVTGESGTGKELIARALHQLSRRSERPLIKVNCAALPANLIESELFGHEKGAFTGAIDKKIGKFELADGGTLFLDEIGELPIELQPKILRALQEGEIERLGGIGTLKVNVRIITATNRDLPKEVSKGNFREDLYYRLNVFPIHSIPLRERKEDIPLLVRFFCEKLGARLGRKITNIPQKVITTLMEYDFPGNVRELENLIERGIIMSKKGKLSLGDWFNPKNKKLTPDKILTLEEMQRQHIAKTLKYTNWKVSGKDGAAKLLDMRPTTLYSKIERLGIKRSTDIVDLED